MSQAHAQARRFLECEAQFRLGFLPTEQPHPLTTGLAERLARDTADGVRLLQSVDATLVEPARRAIASPAFAALVDAMADSLRRGGRVFFTGCGATGRLSILLEAAWRAYWQRTGDTRLPDAEGRVVSVMAGGDFALIRSVEGFEDFTDFGRHQLTGAGVAAGDTVVAITEGGETSFVIGTAWRGLEAGAATFFVFNNPADTLAQHVERSRRVIDDRRVTKLELFSGPMAVAGSTRMQATTLELLVVGHALEAALARAVGDPAPRDAADALDRLLAELAQPGNVRALADLAEFEEAIYRRHGLVTYFADEYLLDILTDTTERSPTFSLPPYRRRDDAVSARSWSFVKSPMLDTPAAWRRVLRREVRGIDWASDDYRAMGAPDALVASPPRLDRAEVLKFAIGDEPDPSRNDAPASAATAVLVGDETRWDAPAMRPFRQGFERHAAGFAHAAALLVGPGAPAAAGAFGRAFAVTCTLPESPLRLWHHLAAKLALNTVSTATMGRVGRLVSNWMVYVNTSNKKLIDRGIRLIADQTGVGYDDACVELHVTLEALGAGGAAAGVSPVAETIRRIRDGGVDSPRQPQEVG